MTNRGIIKQRYRQTDKGQLSRQLERKLYKLRHPDKIREQKRRWKERKKLLLGGREYKLRYGGKK